MLVDNNHIFQPSYFTSGASSSSSSSGAYPDYTTDLNDIFDTELFNSTFALGSTSAPSSTSRGSSPQSLMTPPQDPLPTSFPDVHDEEGGSGNSSSSFYSLFDDDPLKTIDGLSMPMPPSTDFMGVGAMDTSYGAGMPAFDMGLGMGGYVGGMDLSSLGVGMGMMDQDHDPMQATTIDPQLVDTPSAVSDHGEEDEDEKESPPSPADAPVGGQAPPVVVEPTPTTTTTTTKEVEKPTITIALVKVGGHGKARKGTVQSGGVVKKTSASATKEKENYSTTTSKKSSPSSHTKSASTSIGFSSSATTSPTSFSPSAYKSSTPGPFLSGGGNGNSVRAESEAGGDEDEDDLPHDWRPSPEVFAKMTSKEKRQLRNKISARNFRIRRKEYIATLEGDIAERDRMLDHFRTQLGSRESENVALRQEIAALKKALLEGRGGPINLPPPAPLPEQSAAEALAAASTTTSSSTTTSNTTSTTYSPLLTPNTQKDLPSSPRLGANAANRFWGGVAGASGLGGGYTPVHTTLVPDVGSVLRRGLLQENMNPALNGNGAMGKDKEGGERSKAGMAGTGMALGGFDGFADLNPFTMKTLDAYRMHLWGKMAQQQSSYNANSHNNNATNAYSPSSSTTSSPSSSPSPPPSSSGHAALPGGLAGNLRPHFFTPSAKANLPASYSGYGSTLSALLSGKHASSSAGVGAGNGAGAYPSPPASPLLGAKGSSASSVQHQKEREMQQRREKEQQQQQQHAMIAAMASQTILGKLGAAFWDAFTGHSGVSASPSASSSGAGSGAHRADWDADKVQRVLSGRAVLRVVDVEPPVSGPAAASVSGVSVTAREREAVKEKEVKREVQTPMSMPKQQEDCGNGKKGCIDITGILEESMRSLTLGKK